MPMPDFLFQSTLLLADKKSERIDRAVQVAESLSGALEADGPLDYTLLILVFAVGGLALAALGIMTWLAKRREEKACNDPVRLFHDLCRGQHLTWGETRLLKRAALAVKAPSPAELFIEPKHLAGLLSDENWSREQGKLKALQEKLFARSS
jgi:hypothetical protein